MEVFTDVKHHSHLDDLHLHTTSLIRSSETSGTSISQVTRRHSYGTCMLKHIDVLRNVNCAEAGKHKHKDAECTHSFPCISRRSCCVFVRPGEKKFHIAPHLPAYKLESTQQTFCLLSM